MPGRPVAADPSAVAVGTVVGAHALQGLVRVRAHQPPAPSIAPGARLLFERMGTWRQLTVTGVAVHGSVLLVALDGVAGRDAAESLRGAHVLVPAGDLPPPEAGEFYWHEVVGFAVDTPSGEHLGTITGTLSTGLHDVWTVRHGEREYLIPVIGDVVRAIDRHARRVVVEPLPGLLE